MPHHAIRTVIVILFLLPSASTAFGQDTEGHRIPVTDVERDIYPWITWADAGPMVWHDDPPSPDEEGWRFRVILTEAEIYDTIFIERIAFGPEGCCAHVVLSRRVDMTALADALQLQEKTWEVDVFEWISPNSFAFTWNVRRFVFESLDSEHILVTETRR